MKKVKYLLGFLVVGIGLLFNQSFGYDFYTHLGMVQINNGSEQTLVSMSSATWGSYLGSTYGRIYPCELTYGTDLYHICYGSSNSTSTTFSNSLTGYSPYNSQLRTLDQYEYGYYNYVSTPPIYNYYSYNYGVYNNFGSMFFYLYTNTTPSPKFGIGNYYLNTYNIYNCERGHCASRLFTTGSVNGYNYLNIVSGSNTQKFYAYEHFDNYTTTTNYGIISDTPNSYKFNYYGLYNMGYSYVYNQLNNTGSISRNNFKFKTVSDNIKDYLQSFNRPNGVISDISNYSYDGFLVLPLNTYLGINNGQIILSKDSSNSHYLLYEIYDCENSDINSVLHDGTCNKLDGGYITNSGNKNILPFIDFNTNYVLNSGDFSNYPIFYSLINYFSNTYFSLLGFTYYNNNNLFLNFNSNSSLSGYMNIQLVSDPSVDFGYDYVNIPGTSPYANSLYYICKGPIYNTIDGSIPLYCLNPDGSRKSDEELQSCLVTYSSEDQELVENVICNIDGFDQPIEVIQDGSGTIFAPCSGSCGISLTVLDNIGFSTGYFEDYLNKTGYFFKCPYSYGTTFTVRPKLVTLLNGYDLVLPINCMIASYGQGKQVFGLFNNSGSLQNYGPIINVDGPDGEILYHFFDFLLILGFAFLFRKILSLFEL